MIKTLRLSIALLLSLAAIAAVGFVAYKLFFKEKDAVSVEASKIADIKTLAELCTMEIYTDMPVKGNIGSKHFFARQTLQGSISFDLDSLSYNEGADTITISLPKEKVELLESTLDGSFRVIDTWNTDFFSSPALSNTEETKIKRIARAKAIASMYADGTVAKARSEAKQRLSEFMRIVYHLPVIVNDSTPKGSNYHSYVREVK